MRAMVKTHNGQERIMHVRKVVKRRMKIDLVNWLNTVDEDTREEVLKVIEHKQQ
jgi:hypothetical protein